MCHKFQREPGWNICKRMQGRKERGNLGNSSVISKKYKKENIFAFLSNTSAVGGAFSLYAAGKCF